MYRASMSAFWTRIDGCIEGTAATTGNGQNANFDFWG